MSVCVRVTSFQLSGVDLKLPVIARQTAREGLHTVKATVYTHTHTSEERERQTVREELHGEEERHTGRVSKQLHT